MALTVPPPSNSFSEFGWIFHNNHLDSSIYQDDDIMDFSDSSGEYPQQQHQQQVSWTVNQTRSFVVCAHVMRKATMMFPLLETIVGVFCFRVKVFFLKFFLDKIIDKMLPLFNYVSFFAGIRKEISKIKKRRPENWDKRRFYGVKV